MDDRLRNPADRRVARRRLLKGSFSAPAILVVSSGSAWANASGYQCVANEVAANGTPSGDLTAYVTVQAYRYNPTGDSKKESRWVKGSDLLLISQAAGVTCFLTAGQYLCMQGGQAAQGADYVAGTTYSNSTDPKAPTSFSLTSGAYVVKFETNGNIVGVYNPLVTSTTSGGAIHTSCWSSFKLRPAG